MVKMAEGYRINRNSHVGVRGEYLTIHLYLLDQCSEINSVQWDCDCKGYELGR